MAKQVDDKIYHECMQLTSQFKFCPNAFRIDMYRGCDFGCKYCFANMEAFHETGTGLSTWREAQLQDVRRQFELALETDRESKSTIVELLRHRVPLHCGGMSDPFQSREWEQKLTYGLIEISNQYNYPISFSTKTDHLPDEYFEILNPKIHAFQSSILGWSDSYVHMWEHNTPSALQRGQFVADLRDKGFWCSIRIQPIINVQECGLLMSMMGDIPSYYTLEHLHVMSDSYVGQSALLQNCVGYTDLIQSFGVTEFKTDVKKRNIEYLMGIANSFGVPVGVGDNDLHYMSQSRCCCGIDLIPEFQNYLKFNSTYFSTGETDFSFIFIPKSNCRRHMNIGKGKPFVYVEDVVKGYVSKNPQLIPDKFRIDVERNLFGKAQKKLF